MFAPPVSPRLKQLGAVKDCKPVRNYLWCKREEIALVMLPFRSGVELGSPVLKESHLP